MEDTQVFGLDNKVNDLLIYRAKKQRRRRQVVISDIVSGTWGYPSEDDQLWIMWITWDLRFRRESRLEKRMWESAVHR